MSKTQIPTGGIADDAIDSQHYADGSIDTAFIGNSQVTAAKTSGVAGLVKIHSFSVSSGDASATLTSKFDSTYGIYKIFLYDWNTSADADARLQWVTGTDTVQSGASSYFYAGVGFNTSGQNSAWSGNTDYIRITGETIRNDADEQFAWEGTLYNPSGTTLKKRLVFAGGGRRTSNYTYNGHGTAEWNSTTAITGFKIFPSAGNFDSLSGAIYGVLT